MQCPYAHSVAISEAHLMSFRKMFTVVYLFIFKLEMNCFFSDRNNDFVNEKSPEVIK